MSSKAPSKPSPKEAKPSPNAPEKPAKEPAPAPTNPSPKPAPAGPSPPPESAPKQPKAKNIEPVASPKASGDKSPVPAPANASKLEKEVSSPRVAPENSDRSSVQRDKSKEMQAERDKRLGKVKAGESGLKQRDGSPSGGSGSPNRIASDQRKRGEKVDGNTSIFLLRASNEQDRAGEAE
jgi:hypothetical protein